MLLAGATGNFIGGRMYYHKMQVAYREYRLDIKDFSGPHYSVDGVALSSPERSKGLAKEEWSTQLGMCIVDPPASSKPCSISCSLNAADTGKSGSATCACHRLQRDKTRNPLNPTMPCWLLPAGRCGG